MRNLAKTGGDAHHPDALDPDLPDLPTFPMTILSVTICPADHGLIEVIAESWSHEEDVAREARFLSGAGPLNASGLSLVDPIGPLGAPRRRFYVDPSEEGSSAKAIEKIVTMPFHPHRPVAASCIMLHAAPRRFRDFLRLRRAVPLEWVMEIRAGLTRSFMLMVQEAAQA